MFISWRTIAVLLFACSTPVDAQGPDQKSGDRPNALEMMEQARTAMISGTVEWTVTDSERTPGRTLRYINRYAANGDRVTEHRGDQDGRVGWDPQENKPVNKFPKLFLQNGKGVFETTETGPTVRWWLPKAELPDGEHRPPPDASDWMDIRSIGMFRDLSSISAQSPEGLWAPPSFRINEQALPEIEWSESRRADKHIVTCRRSDGVEIERTSTL